MTHRTNRLGAFLFFDKDGIVGEYVEYLLDAMNKHLSELIVICNCEIREEEKEKLEKRSNRIFYRENKGYDAGGWKDLFTKFVSDEDIKEFDEVIIFNDSFFGPVHPLEEMFSKMDGRDDLDFWGITKHGKLKDPYGLSEYGYFPEHIQSYFIGIRKNMFVSDAFADYWNNLHSTDNLEEAISYFEVTFTKVFSDKGFKWDVYVNTDNYIRDGFNNINVSFFEVDKLVIERGMPFVKRKALYEKTELQLKRTESTNARNCIEYIDRETDYPIEYIWRQLIRTVDMRDLYESFHLDYIIPSYTISEQANKHKIALVIHLYYPELFEYCSRYAMSMPDNSDIYITTSRIEYIDQIKACFEKVNCKSVHIIEVDGRGRDISGLLVGAREIFSDYEYVCFIHDKMSLKDNYPRAGKAFCDLLFESLLHSRTYVDNIIKLFDNNNFLGILVPPIPFAAGYFKAFCDSWVGDANYQNTLDLCEQLNLNCVISRENSPLAIGSAFWCRTDALKKIFDYRWDYTDFPSNDEMKINGTISHAIERIFSYVAQDAGYLTGSIYTKEIAELRISTMSFMLRNIVNEHKKMKAVKITDFYSVIKSIRKKTVFEKNAGKEIQKYNSGKYLVKKAIKKCIKKIGI